MGPALPHTIPGDDLYIYRSMNGWFLMVKYGKLVGRYTIFPWMVWVLLGVISHPIYTLETEHGT